jgi:hypothetical protein
MAKSPGTPGFDMFDMIDRLQKARDQGITAWAKATLRVTSSEPYLRATGLLMQPGLLATAFVRNSTEKTMSELLARFNMPSREEVLSLSQRLTRIEVVLDDLSAAVDAIRGPHSQPEETPAKASQGNGNGTRVRVHEA